MNLYIAYKFSNVENKQTLRDDVQTFANILEQKGHRTYVLGRDLQKWQDFTHSLPHKTKTIMKQIRNADVVVALINSEVFSRGLLFELSYAKLIGKKIIIAQREGINEKILTKFSKNIIKFKDFEDLKNLPWQI